MKDDPRIQIELNRYEQVIFDYIAKHPGQNEKQIRNALEMNKNTIAKYLKQLCDNGFIEFVVLKQDVKAYFVRIKYSKSFSESHTEIKNQFNDRRALVRKCLNSLADSPHQEAVHVYSKCIELVLAFDKIIKFTISVNAQKKLVKQWLELQKANQELLYEITSGISQTLYARVLFNMEKSASGITDELEDYIKNKQQKLVG